MRLPRMTTRQWMMVVAEVGLLIGASISEIIDHHERRAVGILEAP